MLPELGWRFPGGKPEQHWRNFTVRRFDPAQATIDVDIYLHGDLGRASAWARRAKAGDPVGYAGPRTHWEPDPDAAWALLAADETGLPALLAILESLPAGPPCDRARRGRATTTSASPSHRGRRRPPLDLARRPPRGHDDRADRRAARARLPPERGQGWGGGEALAMRDVRRHLVANHPAVAPSLNVMGYWKHRAHARGRGLLGRQPAVAASTSSRARAAAATSARSIWPSHGSWRSCGSSARSAWR